MGITWAASADRHGISHEDALYAITNAQGSVEIEDDDPDSVTTVYVGHPHAQTDRYIEVIVAARPPRTLVVFHVMELSDLFRHLVKREGERP